MHYVPHVLLLFELPVDWRVNPRDGDRLDPLSLDFGTESSYLIEIDLDYQLRSKRSLL